MSRERSAVSRSWGFLGRGVFRWRLRAGWSKVVWEGWAVET